MIDDVVSAVEGVARTWKADAERWRAISPADILADALTYCAKEIEGALSSCREKALVPPAKIECPPKQCHVYVVRRADSAEVKIGISTDPLQRLRQLQTSHSEDLELVASFPGDVAEEARLHERFKAHRKRGEWFSEAPEISAWIREVGRNG